MKNRLAVHFCLFLLACQISDAVSSEREHARIREKRNIICLFGLTDVIKETLYAALLDARKQDPVSLSDAWEGQLEDGQLRGLLTLRNVTELRVFCNDDDIIVFTTTLRLRDAEIRYKWKRRVVFKFKGSAWVRAKEVDFDLEVRLNTTGGLNFQVANSLVTKVDDFQVGFKGLGVLNPVVKKVLKKAWKKKAADKIGTLVKRSLERQLDAISDTLDWMTFL